VKAIPGLVFRLAAAQALALQEVDVLIAPDLSAGVDIARGGGRDPWIASFPEALTHTVSGLPPVFAVPASLGGRLETVVIETLYSICRDPFLVRRVWDRYRSAAYPSSRSREVRVMPGAAAVTIGVLGQPWLLDRRLFSPLLQEGEAVLGQDEFAPEILQDEGDRVNSKLLPTDREVLGAASIFSRRGGIARISVIAKRGSATDAWLCRRIEGLVHKPLSLHYLEDLLEPEEAVSILLALP